MPSIGAHMVMAKLVGDMLNISDDEFIKGNLYPDIILDDNSHHKIKGKYFLIPDINYFKKTLDFTNPFHIGMYTHLLLDKHFLEEFIPEKVNDLNVFENGIIYSEYDYINGDLVEHFNVDTENYSDKLIKLDELENINSEKLLRNIAYFNNRKTQKTLYLKKDEFIEFLSNIANVISEEIKNASECYRMSLCPSE